MNKRLILRGLLVACISILPVALFAGNNSDTPNAPVRTEESNALWMQGVGDGANARAIQLQQQASLAAAQASEAAANSAAAGNAQAASDAASAAANAASAQAQADSAAAEAAALNQSLQP